MFFIFYLRVAQGYFVVSCWSRCLQHRDVLGDGTSARAEVALVGCWDSLPLWWGAHCGRWGSAAYQWIRWYAFTDLAHVNHHFRIFQFPRHSFRHLPTSDPHFPTSARTSERRISRISRASVISQFLGLFPPFLGPYSITWFHILLSCHMYYDTRYA